MITLTDEQRRIVEYPSERGHLLVLAGPGSGKTRVICERIGFLLHTRKIDPEQILPLAFTRRAGVELQNRLADANYPVVNAGTIHAWCTDVLSNYGHVIGAASPLRIADRDRQRELVVRAFGDVTGHKLIADDPVNRVRSIVEAISRHKLSGSEIWPESADLPLIQPLMEEVDYAYHQLLADEQLLDFDDLIVQTIRLLAEDEPTATIVRNRWRFVFVDEFHDLSPEQYHLLRLIAPGSSPNHQVMIVADTDQAIFAFRGANAEELISRFRHEYHPGVHHLSINHRSSRPIAASANKLIAQSGDPMVTSDGLEVTCTKFTTGESEAKQIARWIQQVHETGKFKYSEIAVLYRTHKRANEIEQTLLAHGIPIRRVQPHRFFNDPGVREALRYLDLIATIHDEEFVSALNWPRVLVDEITMVKLRRLAQNHGLSLSQLVNHPDLLRKSTSPLTRISIASFMETAAAELKPFVHQPISEISERLLKLLNRRRDPVPDEERETWTDTLRYLGRDLNDAVIMLDQAIQQNRPIQIVANNDLDSQAAKIILQSVCERYFDYPLTTERIDLADQPFVIYLGRDEPVTLSGFGLDIFVTRTAVFSVAARAWRLGQLLLLRHEPGIPDRFVAFDLETSSILKQSAEILEVAALRITPDGTAPFTSLIRPHSPTVLSGKSQSVHGLTWETLKNAPLPEEIVPDLLDFLGNDIIVGHFASGFDIRVIQRVAAELGLTPPSNLVIDTLFIAQRLLPHQSHKLQELAQHYNLPVSQAHRADADAQLTAELLRKLLQDLHKHKEQNALIEALPLVAIGTVAAGLPLAEDNTRLVRIGARAIKFGQGRPLLDQLHCVVSSSLIAEQIDNLGMISKELVQDDINWEKKVIRWREVVATYARNAPDQSLPAFLHFAALADAADLDIDDSDRVTMMTIHSAKGSEWPLVFLIGLEDDTTGAWKNKTPEEKEEERRVLYVGMTRAQRRLLLSWAKTIGDYEKTPLPFLKELTELPSGMVKFRSEEH